jgi:hypothetical protein
VIGVYFTRGGVTSMYGAAGALLVALLWIYYSLSHATSRRRVHQSHHGQRGTRGDIDRKENDGDADRQRSARG